jgi:hypothetical protein
MSDMTEKERQVAAEWTSKALIRMVSIGRLAETCQCTVTRVISAAVAAGVNPDMFIDGVCFFSEGDAEKIMVHIASSRQASAESAAQKGMN